MEGMQEEKKSFMWIYIGVAVFYAIMITVYGVVVHQATLDGAQDVAPIKSESNDTKDAAEFTSNFVKMITAAVANGDLNFIQQTQAA